MFLQRWPKRVEADISYEARSNGSQVTCQWMGLNEPLLD